MVSNICDRLRAGVVTASAAETRELARELAPLLPSDAILALHGDLGVGKTTFVQGLAEAFCIQEPVTSPTFTIFTLHRGPQRLLVHLDAYRLDASNQIDSLMLEDFLIPPYCLAVEWPERIATWLPLTTWHFELKIGADHRHAIRLL